jgi:hypothetical protein
MTDDKARGLYQKYQVKRLADHDGKHAACEFFVLDPLHDPIARAALINYISRLGDDSDRLAVDLREMIARADTKLEAMKEARGWCAPDCPRSWTDKTWDCRCGGVQREVEHLRAELTRLETDE